MKRLFDLVLSLIALLIISPVFLVIALIITLDSKGSVFYRQVRIGKNRVPFRIFKFRTMHTGADKSGLLTVGGRDSRITKPGYYLRKYKLDELPQLINVVIGDMSLVGPRPEVQKYVDMYNTDQLKVLSVLPGITDYASIEFSNENEILAKAENPEKEYIDVVMPAKLKLNQEYIRQKGMLTDIKIILQTLKKIMISD